jgi:PAS domain S-box-containing protein
MIGKSIMVLAPPGQLRRMVDLLATPVPLTTGVEQVRRDGERVHVSLFVTVERDTAGAATGVTLIAHDVTARVRAEEAVLAQREQMDVVVATAGEPFIAITELGEVVEWNARAAQVFGWTRAEVRGRELAEVLVPERDRAAHREGLDRMRRGEPARLIGQSVELTAVHRDGTEIPVELTVSRLHRHGRNYFTAFLRDASQRKRVEQALADARDQALATSRLKSQFLASISHEIRTPMNGVIGLTGLLLATPLTTEQRQYIEGIRAAGSALLTVINDVLDFSKIEAGGLTVDNVDFHPASVLADVLALAGEPGDVTVSGCCDPGLPATLHGDAGRLRQVLLNLVANAVKFTERGTVTVRVGSQPDRSIAPRLRVRFEVTDTGVGIAAADTARIFEPFTQADASATRRFGGTGLGLAISRQLVELMDGDIGVTSEPGRGSTFWFTVPLRPGVLPSTGPEPDRVALAAAGVAPAPQVRSHVLLVEDNELNRTVALAVLAGLGYTADSATNGREAVDLTLRHRYDAVLMDCQMPVLDGYAATAEIRRGEGTGRHTPIIAMTASALDEDRARCLAAGMDDHVAKPIVPRAVDEALCRFAGTPGMIQTEIDERLARLRGPHPAQSTAFLEALLRSVLDAAPGLLREITEAVDRGDAEALRRRAHALRGVAINIGARPVAETCADLEEIGRAAAAVPGTGLADAGAGLARLTAGLDEVYSAVRAILARSPT